MLKKLTVEKSRKAGLHSDEMSEVKGGESIFSHAYCISNMYMWMKECEPYQPGSAEMKRFLDAERANN